MKFTDMDKYQAFVILLMLLDQQKIKSGIFNLFIVFLHISMALYNFINTI